MIWVLNGTTFLTISAAMPCQILRIVRSIPACQNTQAPVWNDEKVMISVSKDKPLSNYTEAGLASNRLRPSLQVNLTLRYFCDIFGSELSH